MAFMEKKKIKNNIRCHYVTHYLTRMERVKTIFTHKLMKEIKKPILSHFLLLHNMHVKKMNSRNNKALLSKLNKN